MTQPEPVAAEVGKVEANKGSSGARLVTGAGDVAGDAPATPASRTALGELLAKGGNVMAGLEEPLLFDDDEDLDLDVPMQLRAGLSDDDDPLSGAEGEELF